MIEPGQHRSVASPDADTQAWWDATKEGRLLVQRCDACGHALLYPRVVCTSCHGTRMRWEESAGRGTLHAFTTVHRSPDPALRAPYVVALVRLDEGPIVMANVIADEQDLACDLPMALVWEDLPDGRRLPHFETR